MDKRAAVFVYSRNGTLEVIVEDLLFPVASGIIIVLCLLAGVCYNLLVIGAIVTSKTSRRSSFHLALLFICVICLLDCVINESLAFGFLYDLGPSACVSSAVAFHVFLLAHSSALSLLFIERALEHQGYSVSVRMSLGGVLTSWTSVIVLSSALIASSDVHFFSNRLVLFPMLDKTPI